MSLIATATSVRIIIAASSSFKTDYESSYAFSFATFLSVVIKEDSAILASFVFS